MIRKVLELINDGKTIYEISVVLDMDYSAVVGMIEHLIKLGYLEEEKRNNLEIKMCSNCPLREFCSKKGFKRYYLTEKGHKVIEKKR